MCDTRIISIRRRYFYLILVLYIAASLGVALYVNRARPEQFWEDDSLSYHDSARALLKLGTFSVSPEQPQIPQTVRTPGYPVFLALVYILFGIRPLPVICFQILINASTLWLTYLLANKLWGEKVALLAVGLLALDITIFLYGGKVLTECCFVFLITLTSWAGGHVFSSSRVEKGWALGTGISLAAATLVRPVSYYLIFPILIGSFLYGFYKRWIWQGILALVLLLFIPYALLVGGWQVRNWLVSGSLEFSRIQGTNLLFYRAADVIALRDGTSFEEARQEIEKYSPFTADSTNNSPSFNTKTGLAILVHYPQLAALSALRGMTKMLIIPGETTLLDYLGIPEAGERGVVGDLLRLSPKEFYDKWWLSFRAQLIIAFYAALYLIVIYVNFVIGFVSALRKRVLNLGVHLFLGGVLLYLLVVSAGPEAYARFRAPLMPLFVVYASYSLFVLLSKIRGILKFG